MDDKVLLAFITVISAGYITHRFTKKRFKEELRIKKNEKNISDIKELINDFEEKLSERIFLTRGYMYDILGSAVTEESSKRYKDVILKWNIDFDYRSNRLSRFGFLSQIKKIDDLQSELKDFHSFLVKCREENNEINKKIETLKKFQTKAYAFITTLNKDVDNQWDRIFSEKRPFHKKVIGFLFDCFFKMMIAYVTLMMILFLWTSFFH